MPSLILFQGQSCFDFMSEKIEALKKERNDAIAQQAFEYAGEVQDEIDALTTNAKGGSQSWADPIPNTHVAFKCSHAPCNNQILRKKETLGEPDYKAYCSKECRTAREKLKEHPAQNTGRIPLGWADIDTSSGKIVPLSQDPACKKCGAPTPNRDVRWCFDCLPDFSAKSQIDLKQLLCDVAAIFDGWHSDGTAWTEWDESVRERVSKCQQQLEVQSPKPSEPLPQLIPDGPSSAVDLAEPSERTEACSICGTLVSDWVDPDWARGMVCRPCESKHQPSEPEICSGCNKPENEPSIFCSVHQHPPSEPEKWEVGFCLADYHEQENKYEFFCRIWRNREVFATVYGNSKDEAIGRATRIVEAMTGRPLLLKRIKELEELCRK